MHARISFVTIKRSGARAVREVDLDVDRIRIGRGTHSEILLSGLSIALDHALIEKRGGEVWIATVRDGDVRVNDRVVVTCRLDPGDVIHIGQHEIRLREPRAGFDIDVEVEGIRREPGAAESLASRTRIGVGSGTFSQKRLAWAAALGVLVIGFAWPVLIERTRPAFDPAAPDVKESRLGTMLVASLATGPVSKSHAYFGDRCDACHRKAFQPVTDRACLDCHRAVAAHAAPPDSESAEFPAAAARRRTVETMACVACHREHGAAVASAAFRWRACAGCHGAASTPSALPASPSDTTSDTTLPATDFATDHPEFRPAVVVDAAATRRSRISLAASPRERSGIRFPHESHLVANMKSPEGETTLTCAHCHVSGARGTTMKPIVFEESCQRCHSLAFDDDHPQRQALHGDPQALLEDLAEFYSTLALRGEVRETAAPQIVRRRPGRDLTEQERTTVLQWVGDATSRVASRLFDRTGACAGCHEVAEHESGVRIAPVRLLPLDSGGGWLPRARFRHDKHGSTSCETCHDVRKSRAADDVLLPGIETCRTCHGGAQRGGARVTSPCTLCHDFHVERPGPVQAGDVPTAGAGARGASPGGSVRS